MLTTSHGDGAGVRWTPEDFEAAWDGVYTRVLNWWEAHQRLNVCPPSEREAAAEREAEAEDEARQFLAQVMVR
jgi:hypothetical protein